MNILEFVFALFLLTLPAFKDNYKIINGCFVRFFIVKL